MIKKTVIDLSWWLFGGWISLLTGLFFKQKGDLAYELIVYTDLRRPVLERIPQDHNYYKYSVLFYIIAGIFLIGFVLHLSLLIKKNKQQKDLTK